MAFVDKYNTFLLFTLENSVSSCNDILKGLKAPSSHPASRAIQNEPIGQYITAQETIQAIKRHIKECENILENIKEYSSKNDNMMYTIVNRPAGQSLNALEIIELFQKQEEEFKKETS